MQNGKGHSYHSAKQLIGAEDWKASTEWSGIGSPSDASLVAFSSRHSPSSGNLAKNIGESGETPVLY